MKRLVAAASIAAALLVPAAPALAGLPAGTRSCPPLHIGIIVWAWDPTTGTNQDVVVYCAPVGP